MANVKEIIINETSYRITTNLGIYLKWKDLFFPKSYPSIIKKVNSND